MGYEEANDLTRTIQLLEGHTPVHLMCLALWAANQSTTMPGISCTRAAGKLRA